MAYLKSVSAGFKTDCENLLRKFVEKQSLRFVVFADVWKEMKFSLIYCGRESFMELWKFTQEALLIAKQFWFAPNSFQVQVGALYLLYGLYHKQIVKGMVKIRVTSEEWDEILLFVERLKQEDHTDAVMIFYSLGAIDDAFFFTAISNELGFELGSNDDAEERQRQKVVPIQNELEQLMEGPGGLLEQLNFVHTSYKRLKSSLQEPNQESLDSSMDIMYPDLAPSLQALLDETKETGLEEDKSAIGPHRQMLKNKALQVRNVYERGRQTWKNRSGDYEYDDDNVSEMDDSPGSDDDYRP